MGKRLKQAIVQGYPYVQRSGFAYQAWLRCRAELLYELGVSDKPPKSYGDLKQKNAAAIAPGQLSLFTVVDQQSLPSDTQPPLVDLAISTSKTQTTSQLEPLAAAPVDLVDRKKSTAWQRWQHTKLGYYTRMMTCLLDRAIEGRSRISAQVRSVELKRLAALREAVVVELSKGESL